jgi:hypothetical protein
MRNPCLDTALRELDAAGIRDVEQVHGGKHIQVRWQANGRSLRVYNIPATPGDWRSVHNTRAGIRRMLREDGMLNKTERAGPTPPSPTPKVDKFAELERRVQALEDFVRTFKTGGDHAQAP